MKQKVVNADEAQSHKQAASLESRQTEITLEDNKNSKPSIQTGTTENLGDALTKEKELAQADNGQHLED